MYLFIDHYFYTLGYNPKLPYFIAQNDPPLATGALPDSSCVPLTCPNYCGFISFVEYFLTSWHYKMI